MRILAVDISNIFRRNWEATQGKEFGEAFHRTVRGVAQYRENFDRVAICCDGGQSFRKAISQQYKSNRTDPGEPYREQLRRALERLDQDGCTVIKAPEMPQYTGSEGQILFAEADDVIGSLTKWAREDGHEVVILSGDKDLCQLVGEGVSILKPEGGNLWGPQQVIDKHGVAPAMIPQLLALAGDDSDGYKPYPGIAEGRAKALLDALGGIAHIWDPSNDAKLDGIVLSAHAKKLRELGNKPALRALDLATIRCDLPIDFSPLLAEPVVKSIVKEPDIKPAAAAPEVRPTQVIDAEPAPSTALAPTDRTAAAIVATRKADPWALQPSGQAGLWKTAEWLANARVFPNLGSPEQIIAATIIAQNLGVPQGLALMHAYVVYGRIGWSAGFIVGLVRRCADCEKFYLSDSTDRSATVIYKRRGEPQGAYTFTFEMADRMQLTGPTRKGEPSMWKKMPHVMCRWGALRECARMVFPDVVAGVYMPDEISGGEMPEDMMAREAA